MYDINVYGIPFGYKVRKTFSEKTAFVVTDYLMLMSGCCFMGSIDFSDFSDFCMVTGIHM